jgi:hypothetical protein
LGSLSPKQELLFEDSKSLCLIIFDELEEIQSTLIDMMQRAGLYFRQPAAV